jgi:hypothetical protein
VGRAPTSAELVSRSGKPARPARPKGKSRNNGDVHPKFSGRQSFGVDGDVPMPVGRNSNVELPIRRDPADHPIGTSPPIGFHVLRAQQANVHHGVKTHAHHSRPAEPTQIHHDRFPPHHNPHRDDSSRTRVHPENANTLCVSIATECRGVTKQEGRNKRTEDGGAGSTSRAVLRRKLRGVSPPHPGTHPPRVPRGRRPGRPPPPAPAGPLPRRRPR